MKAMTQITIGKLGYTILKADKAKPQSDNKYPSFINGFLSGLLASKGKIGIIQCGANDGLTVDPLAGFIQENITVLNAVLIEPLPDVFDTLSARYLENQNIVTLNLAIGPGSSINLFRIKKQYADKYKGIIASGVTSFDKDYVLRKAENMLDIAGVPPEDRIEKLTLDTVSITHVIQKYENTIGIDPFIQIDAEGFDDQIIYSLDFDLFQPVAISYEARHLKGKKLAKLHSHLKSKKYKIVRWSKNDEIAIRSS